MPAAGDTVRVRRAARATRSTLAAARFRRVGVVRVTPEDGPSTSSASSGSRRASRSAARSAVGSAGCSSSRPSASVRSAGSRWPQSTSRSTARRQPPSSATSASTSGRARTRPATAARSSAIASRSRRSSASRSLGRRRRSRRAARHAARSRARRGRRAARGAASSQSVSASSAARALAAELEAPQRPRELARARGAAGDEGAERAQRVLLLGREQAVAVHRAAGRWRAGSPATGRRPCAPRRSGRARARRRPTAAARSAAGAAGARPPRGPALARRALEREHRDGRVLVAAQLGRRVGERRAAHEREPVAERHLVGLDHEPLDGRRHDRERAAGVGGLLELGVGARRSARASKTKSVASPTSR